MISNPVFVISTTVDAATDAVEQALAGKGVPCIRLDTERLPFETHITFAAGHQDLGPTLRVGSDFASIGHAVSPRSIWYRRVRSPACPTSMDCGVYDFCIRESRAALVGSCLAQTSRFMSHPSSVWQAEFKPYQLAVASNVGLCIPETIITNCPGSIREFYDKGRRALIIKPVRSGYFESGGEPRVIYTSRFLDEHASELESARLAPSIYQEFVSKAMDIRVTYVGGRCFSAAIHSQSDEAAAVDWRRTEDANLPHSRHELPVAVEKQIHEFMNALNLQFGALDFALTPDGIYYFLEVNPNGQWLWIDRILDLGITDAVADWLAT